MKTYAVVLVEDFDPVVRWVGTLDECEENAMELLEDNCDPDDWEQVREDFVDNDYYCCSNDNEFIVKICTL